MEGSSSALVFTCIVGKRCMFKGPFRGLVSTMNLSSLENGKEFKIEIPYGFIAAKIWNGTGKKRPIVALHGWMDNAGTWDRLIPLLDKEHPFVAFDAPGHGLSSHPPAGLGTYVTDNLVTLHRVLQHLQWKQVILLGHSMGGGVSMLYAGTVPERVDKLIMIDFFKLMHVDAQDQPQKTARSLDSLLKAEEKLLSEQLRYHYKELVERLVKSYGQSLTPYAAETLLKRGARRHEDGKYSFTHSPLLRAVSTLSMTLEQQEAFASKIKCDFLLIKAASSHSYTTKEALKRILDVYKKYSRRFVLEIVEGTHHVHLTDPEPVAKVINAFLQGLPQEESKKSRTEDYLKSVL